MTNRPGAAGAPAVVEIDGEHYFGIFAALAQVGSAVVQRCDLYDEPFATHYATNAERYSADVSAFAALARKHPGRTLELGCGSGRLALPLAAAGADVDAVDASSSMLRLLGDRLAAADPEVARRVRPLRADLLTLDIAPARYDLIVVGAALFGTFATIGGPPWLAGLAQALTPGGVLCFDLDPPRSPVAGAYVRSGEFVFGDAVVHLVEGTVTSPDGHGHIVNMYAEWHAGGRLSRRLASETVRSVDEQALEAGLREAGLAIGAISALGEGTRGLASKVVVAHKAADCN